MVPRVRPSRLYPLQAGRFCLSEHTESVAFFAGLSDTPEIDSPFDPTANNRLGEYQLIDILEAASLCIQPPISSVGQC